MNFTDDDLKKLKEINDANRNIEGMTVFPVVKIEALLARLEAAEKVCNKVLLVRDTVNLEDEYKAWRKAAGK